MRYEESAPLPPLRQVVERIWTLTGDATDLGGQDQPVLPDGRPELILHFGDRFDRVDHVGQQECQPAIIFAGQLTAQLTLRPAGRIRVLGIRFHPYGAAALGLGPLSRLSGLTVGVGDVSSPLSAALARVRDATDDASAAVPLVQLELLRLLDASRIDHRVRHAVAAIEARRGQISITRLASDVSCTRRHLERRFLDAVGIGPKRLARIVRFAACGYADQAHFIRDFRDLAGCSPGDHLLGQGLLTGFFTGRV